MRVSASIELTEVANGAAQGPSISMALGIIQMPFRNPAQVYALVAEQAIWR